MSTFQIESYTHSDYPKTYAKTFQKPGEWENT